MSYAATDKLTSFAWPALTGLLCEGAGIILSVGGFAGVVWAVLAAPGLSGW